MSIARSGLGLLSRVPAVRSAARSGWLPRRLQGRLKALSLRPSAPFRAVAVGFEPESWTDVDAAFPEFSKLFARRSVKADDLIGALPGADDVLMLGELAPARLINAVVARHPRQLVHVSRGPLARIAGAPCVTSSWSIDTLGHWRRSRRMTEMGWILSHFDFSSRPGLLDEAAALLSAIAAPAPAGARVLVIAPDLAGPARRAMTAAAGERLLAEARALGSDDIVYFDAHHHAAWHDEGVEAAFDAALADSGTVVTEGSALGIRAMLKGRHVVVFGQPFYAGYGLTEDRNPVRRPRELTLDMFAAGVALLASRYVADGRLVDPLSIGTRPDA